ncbi:MAG: hypothetical protein JWP36_735 [Paucimonas sp.]|nr:hypothetical protein [Paucimonas sp.]
MPGYRQRQAGQALLFGLFLLTGSLAALFYLFNTGQLVHEKTRLVNTADAVAYSAGVMHARTMNFEAYTNRAMVANTVAIAQLVSLSSWVEYVNKLATSPAGLDTSTKYPSFIVAAIAAKTTGQLLEASLNTSGMLEGLAQASDGIVQSLQAAQRTAHNGLLPARQQVMNAVAQANFPNDGLLTAEPLDPQAEDYPSFVRRYSGKERTRFAEVVTVSAKKDGFVSKRSWHLDALRPNCSSAFPRRDWMDRRGGTELVEFEQWSAVDTLSEKVWVPSNMFDALCSALSEQPVSWGKAAAGEAPGDLAGELASADPGPELYDGALRVNPAAYGLATAMSSSAWAYSGLPGFYDLSSRQDDPRLRFSVRVRRDISQTRTAEGRSAVRPAPQSRLNDYQAQPAGGRELVAVATSEVFFDRAGGAGANGYGQSQGLPQEIGSLFNPYWQVRLIHSSADVQKARGMQGVQTPGSNQ